MAFTLLQRFLARHAQPDGADPALEEAATGIPPALLDPAAELPPAPAARRDRTLGTGKETLVDSIGAKVLHGWLQNRHQTLYPLTVNLRTLRPDEAEALARWMAVAALAGSNPGPGALRAWLEGAGAGPDALRTLEDALAAPPALHAALSAVSHGGLAAYGYVVALVALDPHDPATSPFLDYAAARLALPPEVVRSANRRYRT